MSGEAAAAPALAALVQRQRPRLVSHLARRLGLPQLGLAEDAVQHACLQALLHWPGRGVPDNPAGWLYRVALNHALDQLRHQAHQRSGARPEQRPPDQADPCADPPADPRAEPVSDQPAEHPVDQPSAHPTPDPGSPTGTVRPAPDAAWPDAGLLPSDRLATAGPLTVPAADSRFAGELDDDELALLFAACHPTLPVASQVAIALRALTGLDLATLADALLTTEAGLAQRLARARQSLAGVPLDIPAGPALAPRREAVLTSLWVLFGEGLKAAGRQPPDDNSVDLPDAHPGRDGGDAGRPQPPGRGMALCWEAIRLARAVAAHPATADASADALAALLLLHGARLTGRLDAQGHIVPLAGQPRDRWDAGMVRLGLRHLQAGQRAQALSRWHVLAGIAAEHAMAPSHAATDWPRIVDWYALLLRLDPSPAPRLGHAVALAEAGEPQRAALQLQALLPQVPAALKAHTLAALARAQSRAGQPQQAAHSLRQAIACVRHAADARLLQQQLQALGG